VVRDPEVQGEVDVAAQVREEGQGFLEGLGGERVANLISRDLRDAVPEGVLSSVVDRGADHRAVVVAGVPA
jgi:hypothetical protein